MKYNINKSQEDVIKFQQGGGFATFTPIIEQQPVQQAAASSGSSKESKHTISSMLDDDVFKDLMGKGLVNDVNGFVSELAKIESASSGAFPYTQGNNRGMALRLVGKINELKNSKGDWDKAVSTATAAGGYGEVAINNDMVYGKDAKGNVSAINVNEYDKHRNQYRLLSVAELLNERQYNPKLTGQNGLFDVANNAIGLDKIKSNLKELIASLGTEDVHNENFYSKDQVKGQYDILKAQISKSGKNPTKEEQSALESLNQIINTPGDHYKVITENSSERNHIDKALDYLWKTMDVHAQQKLKATAIVNGGKDPRDFILDMLVTNTTAKTASIISPEKLPGAVEEASASTKGMANISPFELLNNGKTGAAPMAWNDITTNKKMMLHVVGASRLSTVDGKPLGMTTLKNVINTEQGMLLDIDKATFGDKGIGTRGWNNIIYDGGTAAKVFMPANSDGTVNYNALKQFNEVQAEVAKHKDWTPAIINDYYSSHGFGYVQVGKDFVVKENNNVKPFLIMYGYTAQNADEVDGNSEIKILDDKEKDSKTEELNAVWKANKVKAPSDWTDWGTDYYKGIVAVPYKRDASIYAASIAGHMQNKQQNLTDARVDLQKYETPPVNTSFSFFTGK